MFVMLRAEAIVMSESSPKSNSKVARVIQKYELTGMGEKLELDWTGEHGERKSLRDLATEFNHAVLEAAISKAGTATAKSDIESAYQTLTDSDVSRADKMRKRRDLEQMGVDVDDVLSDFITHQTIYKYLTEEREAQLPERSGNIVDRKIETLEQLQGRTSTVTEATIDDLLRNDELTDHDYEVFVNTRVVCGSCGTDYAATELLREGGCDCDSSEENI